MFMILLMDMNARAFMTSLIFQFSFEAEIGPFSAEDYIRSLLLERDVARVLRLPVVCHHQAIKLLNTYNVRIKYNS